MNESIHIAFVADDRYIPYLAVTALSVIANYNGERALVFHIVHDGISDANLRNLNKTLTAKNVFLDFIEVNPKDYEDLVLTGYFSRACYFRIDLPKLLGDSIKKVIYLDCDVLVLDNIDCIWSLDLLQNALLAAPDPLCFARSEILEFPRIYKYFNSGVMVMNLQKWRTTDLSKKVISYIRDNPEKISFPDQDGLNAIMYNDWGELPMSWNQMHYFYKAEIFSSGVDACYVNLMLDAAKAPSIIHFTGADKPWLFFSQHPNKGLYKKYQLKTGWPRTLPTDLNLLNLMKFLKNYILNLLKRLFPTLSDRYRSWRRQNQ